MAPVKATFGMDMQLFGSNNGNADGALGSGAAAPTVGQTGIGDGQTAYSFDGGDYVNIYSSELAATFNGATGSLLVWVRITDAAVWSDATARRSICLGADNNNRIILGRTSTNNTLTAFYIAGGTSQTVTDTSLGATTAWFLAGITWDKAADQMKMYLNGAQVGATQTALGTWAGALASTRCALGALDTAATQPHKGLLAHGAVFTTVLSDANMLAIYNAQAGAERTTILNLAPLAYWMLNESSGTTAVEETRIWTSITSDVRATQPLHITYGISGNGPLDRIAETGAMGFSLDNSRRNSQSASGAYSPDHAALRYGFALGRSVRAKFTYSGSTFYKFIGRLDTIEPLPGRYQDQSVRCTAVDWFDEAAKFKLNLLPVQINQRANANIATVIGNMTKKPSASSLATGQDIFPYAMDNSQDEQTTAMAEMAKNVQSELGYLYPVADASTGGVLTFDDRHTRPKTTTISASFSGDMTALTAARERSKIFNRIKAQSHPREVDAAASILFTLQSKPLIGQSGSLGLVGQYTDPAQRGVTRIGGASMVAPASTTDFLMNSASDGTGTNLTANFTVAASYGGNSVKYKVTNNGTTDGYITKLQSRGIGIYDKEPIVSEKLDTLSINSYGESVLEFDMPYQNSTLVADDAANFLLSTNKDPVTRISTIEFVGNRSDKFMAYGLQVEPGDLITISENMTGLATKSYFVNGAEIQHSRDGETRFLWHITPADSTAYWVLGIAGYSELDTTTRLGY